MMEKFHKLQAFLGKNALRLCMLSILVGFFHFVVEMSFVYILQGFLLSIHLLSPAVTFLPGWYPQNIVATTVIFICFGLTRAVAAFLRLYIIGTTNQAFVRHQRSMLLEYALFNSSVLSTHEITSTFGDRVNSASYVLTRISDLTIFATSVIFLTVFAVRLAPIELILGLSLLMILIYPLTGFKKRIANISEDIDQTTVSAAESVLNSVRNNFFLKVHGLLESEFLQGKEYLRYYEKQYKSYQLVAGLNAVVPAFAGILVISIISYISISYIHTPAMKLVSFFYIFMRLSQAASEAYSSMGEVRLNKLALKKIYDWNKKLTQFKIDHRSRLETSFARAGQSFDKVMISARNLSFSYAAEEHVFADLNFDIGPGKILLIRGQSGAGKSTLLAVLMGVYKPTTGEILVNHKPAQEVLGVLRNSLAFVGPEPFLKPGTLRNNLMYGHPSPESIQDSHILAALEQCHMAKIVQDYEKGLDQYLYEFTQLSTGQKQRLSLARALLRNPKLLILDEATANLDKETEEDILKSLLPIIKNMCVIIVSHKDTFNHIASEVILMNPKIHSRHSTEMINLEEKL